jgi:hypothetical protein
LESRAGRALYAGGKERQRKVSVKIPGAPDQREAKAGIRKINLHDEYFKL